VNGGSGSFAYNFSDRFSVVAEAEPTASAGCRTDSRARCTPTYSGRACGFINQPRDPFCSDSARRGALEREFGRR